MIPRNLHACQDNILHQIVSAWILVTKQLSTSSFVGADLESFRGRLRIENLHILQFRVSTLAESEF